MYKAFLKRLIDFFGALLLLIVLSPIFLAEMIILTIANSGSPFFTQTRPGKKEKMFKLVKFKTMNDKKDANGNLLPDKDRMTKVGTLFRKLSLDELPQLINVLRGDMSLIGPRPLLVEYLPLYNNKQRTRHNVRPGITGWAQVNGRNSISWQQKFEFDAYYVENCSLPLDIKIIFMTALKLIKIEGISSETSVTMEKFTGN
jgi:lipopolysaccharide/colanic/teichoic acid biosynthesis glycosyltransferase